MVLPVGWFPDPTDPGREMLWDGEQWTGLTRPRRGEAAPTRESTTADIVDDPTQQGRPRRASRRRTTILAVVIAAVVILGGGGAATAFAVHTKQLHAEEAKRKQESAAEEKQRADEAQRAEDAQKEADDAERGSRADMVTEVEASVKKLAAEDAAKDLIDGPILSVSCNPVSGSTDDLTDTTTSFDCFAANTNNADGTQSGYFFNATVNWDTGEYTYGLGKSGA